MKAEKLPISIQGLGFASVIFGLLGAAFYWWAPMGTVMSLSGLMAGFIGWTYARSRTTGLRLVIVGMLVSLAALVLNLVIADLGLELIKFQALR